MRIAVQLYTLRDLLASDTWGTLRRLADMGFKTGQLAGTYGKGNDEFAAKCKELGLRVVAPHMGIGEFEDRLESVVSLCKAMGTDTAVLPYVGEDVYAGGWAKAAERFNAIGRRMKDKGLRFLYHNHSFEFRPDGGRPGFDVLWDSVDPALVQCEMDAYWVVDGGGDPVRYLKSMKGRVKTMHFKDMKPGEKREMEDVGYGKLDWDAIIPAAIECGVEYAIIEHDSPPRDPLQHVARSRDFLLGKGLKD
jgi:sugar phosphate isomerase/epimerase